MKFICLVISIFAAYGIYTAVMLNDDAQGAAIVEATISGMLTFMYLKGCVRCGKNPKRLCILQRGQS